jgi:hypothetical protein
MPYTKEDRGLVNNFAPETKTYKAEPPTKAQKRNYFLYGIAAILLVGGLVYIAYSASSVS